MRWNVEWNVWNVGLEMLNVILQVSEMLNSVECWTDENVECCITGFWNLLKMLKCWNV